MQKISKSIIEFLCELSENNRVEWFHANKRRYEKEAKAPFLEFVSELRERLLPIEPRLGEVPVKKMIFRINRDIRFSKDKSPYKDHFAALISPFGTKNKMFPAHYLHVSPAECFTAGGIYSFEKTDQLQQVRSFVAANSERFSKLINDKNFESKYGELQGEKHKRVPPEFKEYHETQPLIANKQFYWIAKFEPKRLQKDDAADFLIDHFAAARDLQTFFIDALGF